ncbi:MAG TPA: M14 family zinc carboxypeptidase [Candidatus Limnocylindrales bacterium]|nr:M14 family zinc carboxypeptidase [Candidatus Limnocylindrales bacterium]
MRFVGFLPAVYFAATLFAQPGTNPSLKPGRDQNQAIDEEYTKKIREYTTETFFNSPLTDYLPASKTVPTPKAELGDVSGAPGILPYSADVYRYMRMLEKATPRVKVFSIGHTEEGREMIAVAVANEKLIAGMDENRGRLAKLADPRTINLNDAEAEKLVSASTAIYYITGTIHSSETGAPTALMELAYRLAVDDSAYIRHIRDNVITLITPVVEVDGRDRMVDIYKWHLANPGKQWPSLAYWGHYVAHDNNRDAMGVTLQLTRNVLNTFVGQKAQVLHDLHESVPYLYDNTVGDGPYNAWIDPILADEWQMMGWNNVSEMTKFGMPGVFTHGTFDTWSPGYLMFIAAMHNGISRLYETFGNGGADTEERTLRPNEYGRTWYRQNPPLPKAKWSQRNNNNYEQTGLLTALEYFSFNDKFFLRNFYLKAKRSIEKPRTEGPAAYVFTADDPRPGGQAELLDILQKQQCEVYRATAPFTVMMPGKRARATSGRGGRGADAVEETVVRPIEKPKPEPRTFPAGSYVIRMDQPYSRIADALLDYQYWAANDPQKSIYDDTGWTFGELGNVQVARVPDVKVLEAAMTRVDGPVRASGGLENSGDIYLVNNDTTNGLMTLRYRFPQASFDVSEEPFEAAGHKFNRGSFIIRNVAAADLSKAGSELGVRAYAVSVPPTVKTHPARAARIAFMHTWLGTQAEGWWRMEFDRLKIPYSYISTQNAAAEKDLRSKYDVIVFGPVGRANPQQIVNGLPMYGNPLPWKVTPQTPNLAHSDETDDMRPGLGWSGLDHLQEFVRKGGLLITATDTSNFAVTFAFTPGVSMTAPRLLKVTGSVLRTKLVDAASPIAYGYSDNLAVYAYNPTIFGVSSMSGGGGGGGGRGGGEAGGRPTGRGTADDPDVPQGRQMFEAPEQPRANPWEAQPITDEQLRNPVNVIPPAQRPRVILRYANAPDLLVSGLLDNGAELAQHPAVIDTPVGEGHVILFSNNPFWRSETQGSYGLVFNAILNFDNLDAGRKLDTK